MNNSVFFERLADLLPFGLGLLVFRTTPFALWTTFSTSFHRRTRIAGALAYGALVAMFLEIGTGDWSYLAVLWGTFVYHGLLACALFYLPPALRARKVSRDVLLGGMILVALLAPSVLLPLELRLLALVYGFELVFSGYSYVVDSAAELPGGEPRTFRQCVFFLLVDPTLVFSQRSKRAPLVSASAGAARVTFAMLTLALKYALSALILAFPALGGAQDLAEVRSVGTYARFWVGMSGQAIVFYLAHSSVASLQIGLMRILGFDTPERYRFPLLARDPLDFWRRWNTYTGGWLRMYVFHPACVWLRRRGVRSKKITLTLAVLGTFATAGLVHEVMVFARVFAFSGVVLLGFLVHGLLVLLWPLLLGLVPKTRLHGASRWSRRIAVLVSNQAFLNASLVSAWLIFSGLAR